MNASTMIPLACMASYSIYIYDPNGQEFPQHAHPEDLAELPDNSVVSERAALSDLTSTSASGMSSASSKVLRIAQQIELLKISSKKNDVEGTTKPSMGSMGKHEKGTPPEKAPLPGSGTKSKAHQAVELILQKAKNRRLASAHGHDHKENRAPCEALAECIHGRAKVPDFVTF